MFYFVSFLILLTDNGWLYCVFFQLWLWHLFFIFIYGIPVIPKRVCFPLQRFCDCFCGKPGEATGLGPLGPFQVLTACRSQAQLPCLLFYSKLTLRHRAVWGISTQNNLGFFMCCLLSISHLVLDPKFVLFSFGPIFGYLKGQEFLTSSTSSNAWKARFVHDVGAM